MTFTETEHARLDAVAEVYDPSDPTTEFDWYTKRLHVEVITPWLRGGRVLEMGCATGELTSLLAPHAADYHVVEGSARYAEVTAARVPAAHVHHALWEDWAPDEPFTDVVCVCALEHVDDPVAVVRRAARWLAPGGRFHVVVPNADSLHRHVGVAMGILPERTALSDSDHRIGHRRVYDVDTLRADVAAAGFAVAHWQGVFLKVLANRQMLGWDWDLVHALHEVGQRFPAHCAELYVVGELR